MSMKSDRILLVVTGLTPQVVTETLFALYKMDELPERVVLLTTMRGMNRAVRDLLDPKDGRFFSFCKEYDLFGKISFNASDIKVIEGPAGMLEDIRSPEDSNIAANFIMRTVQSLCTASNIVHVSIAGGRKTMGFLAGYALSIFGRDCDRLSHVLVSEPFESNRDFFYPSRNPSVIFSPDGRSLDPSTAKVSLADIPFVRLRSGLTEDLLNGCSTFSEAISLAQTAFAPKVSLRFIRKECKILIADKQIKLTPTRFIAYYWLAMRAKSKLPPTRLNDPGEVKDFLALTRDVFGEFSNEFGNFSRTLKHPEDLRNFIQEQKSRINQKIQSNLGKKALSYLVTSFGKRPYTSYGLALEPEQINISK